MSLKQRRVDNACFKQTSLSLKANKFGCWVVVIGIVEYIFGPMHVMEEAWINQDQIGWMIKSPTVSPTFPRESYCPSSFKR